MRLKYGVGADQLGVGAVDVAEDDDRARVRGLRRAGFGFWVLGFGVCG